MLNLLRETHNILDKLSYTPNILDPILETLQGGAKKQGLAVLRPSKKTRKCSVLCSF